MQFKCDMTSILNRVNSVWQVEIWIQDLKKSFLPTVYGADELRSQSKSPIHGRASASFK